MNRKSNSWSKGTPLLLRAAALLASLNSWPVLAEDSPPATADVARAENLSAEAYEAYSSQDFDQAIALYRKAYEASPSADIVYNLARIYDTKLRDRGLALEYYARYADDPGAEPARMELVTARLAHLRELEAVTAPKPSAAAKPRQTEAAISQTPKSTDTSTVQHASGLSTAQVVGILVGAAGVAGLGVGAGFGILARSDADVAHGLCDGNNCISQRGVDAANDANRSATISTVAFLAGGALLAGGAALIVFGAVGSEREVAAFRFLPYATDHSLGTQLAGRW